jgi:hypothetical protein
VSTLEERALADSDDSDRFVTSRVNDAITSLVSAANMAGKAMGERDSARLALVKVTAERDAALAALARVEALHVRDGNDPDPDAEWCAACGFGWPCSTIRALTEWNA